MDRLDVAFGRLLAANEETDGPPSEFLRFRRRQLELILHHARIPRPGLVLEIGGGVSGHAFLLTTLADRVVCTDLLAVGSSYGGQFTKAAALRHADPNGRLHYVCARGEALPLHDRNVDVVFSSFVLEHIADREAAVREIYRVLRPGGYAITIVPNRLEPVYRALGFYLGSVPKQVLKTTLFWSGLARALRIHVAVPPAPVPRTWADAERLIRTMFTYPPHGAYSSHAREFIESGIRQWDRLFEGRGFRIRRRFTVTLENHFSFLNSRLTYRAQEFLMPFTRRYGATPLAVLAGVSYCFVAQRD